MTERLHYSALRQMAKSPAHYRAYARQQLVQTPEMRFGVLVHALLLGGEYVVYDGKRCGGAWKLFKAHHAGKTIVTISELKRAKAVEAGIRENITAVDGAEELLSGAAHEVAIDWGFRGRPCSSRLDVVGPGWITDLKLTSDAHPKRFAWHSRRMLYHAQMAFYLAASGCKDAFIVAAEPTPPYAVTVLRMTPRALDVGMRSCTLWLEQLQACEAADSWPAYSQSIVSLDLPDDELELTFAADATEEEARDG